MNNPTIPTLSGTPDLEIIRRMRGWILALGLVLLAIGIAAIIYPVAATIASMEILGVILILAALGQAIAVFQARGWGGSLMAVLAAAVYLFAGVVLIERPGLTAEIYTLFLTMLLFAVGAVRIAAGLMHNFPGRGWTIVHGVIAIVLAMLLWQGFPETGLWVIGLFVGIELVFAGLFWIMLAASVKKDASAAN